ncbi:Velvet factor-like protein 3 [Elsinoe fawcettii]|nr:Velvet factor-like protein 3 [Elsinoe fawcettii]
MPPPYPPHDPRGMAPPRDPAPDRPVTTRSTALPIAALLSDPAPEKDERSNRMDSFVHAGHSRGMGSYSSTDRAPLPLPPMPQYSPYPPSRSPTSPYGPGFPPTAHYAPPPLEHYQPQANIVRPVFTSPFAGSHPTPVYHSRQPSSIHSPTSGSAGSQRAYSSEPHSATSEHPMMAHAFPPVQPQDPAELEYTLIMRQQPKAARACGFGERDRRVIDPPPIIEVKARDPVTGETHLEGDSYCTLHCVLVNAITGQDESTIPAPRPDMPTAQRLMGAAVASPWVGNDEHGIRGSFFVFADLSVRSPGKYKLLFRLLKVNPLAMSKKNPNFIRATIESEAFDVFTAKEFPGMRASSALLRALRGQGLNVGVKKGSETKGKNKGDIKDEDSDEESDEEEQDDADDVEEESSRTTAKAKADDAEPGSSKDKGKGRAKRAKKS